MMKVWVSALLAVSCTLFLGNMPSLSAAAAAAPNTPSGSESGCQHCERQVQTDPDLTEVEICWVPDADGGHDGQCKAPDCPRKDCVWAGELQVYWEGTGERSITIKGPGEDVDCDIVLNGQFCGKSFGGTSGNPMSAFCPKGSVDVEVMIDDESTLVKFVCGDCK